MAMASGENRVQQMVLMHHPISSDAASAAGKFSEVVLKSLLDTGGAYELIGAGDDFPVTATGGSSGAAMIRPSGEEVPKLVASFESST